MLIQAGKSIGTLAKDLVAEILLGFGTQTKMAVYNEYHSLWRPLEELYSTVS